MAPASAMATTAVGSPIAVSGTGNLFAVACPTSTHCIAVGTGPAAGTEGGAVVVQINNGVPGAAEAVPGEPANSETSLDAITCVSTTTCYAVGNQLLSDVPETDEGAAVVTITNGVPGPVKIAPETATQDEDYGPAQFFAINCPGDSSDCVAVGETDEGSPSTGMTAPVTNGTPGMVNIDTQLYYLNSVFCSSGACRATAVTSTGGVLVPISGATPGTPQPVSGAGTLNASACESTTDCVLLGVDAGGSGDGVVIPFNNGTAGSGVTNPDPLRGIGCQSSSSCYGVGETGGGDGVVLPITNAVPGTEMIDTSVESLANVACTSATSCEAVGSGDGRGVVVPITNGSSTGPGGPGGTAHLTVGKASAKGSAVSVKVSCSTAARCAGTVTETTKVRKRVGHKDKNVTETVAKASYSLAAGAHETVTLKLNGTGGKLLSKNKKLKVQIVVLLGSGKSAKTVSSRSLTLK